MLRVTFLDMLLFPLMNMSKVHCYVIKIMKEYKDRVHILPHESDILWLNEAVKQYYAMCGYNLSMRENKKKKNMKTEHAGSKNVNPK